MKKTYFTHDSNARNDLKLIKLRRFGGWEFYGIYFALLELLFTEENELCINDYETLAYGLQCEPEKLKQVIEDFDLFVIEGDFFHSKRLLKQIEEINNKSIKASLNAKKRWDNTNVMRSQSKPIASKVISKSKEKKSKVKKIYIPETENDFQKEVRKIDSNNEYHDEFIDYWTEMGKGVKIRFQMEKTWNTSRRLSRWASNGFNKNKSGFPEHYDEMFDKRLDQTKRNEYYKHLKSLGYKSIYSPNAGTKWIKA